MAASAETRRPPFPADTRRLGGARGVPTEGVAYRAASTGWPGKAKPRFSARHLPPRIVASTAWECGDVTHPVVPDLIQLVADASPKVQRWFEKNRHTTFTCHACGETDLSVMQTRGRHQCYYHPGKAEFGPEGGHAWTCCGEPFNPIAPFGQAEAMRTNWRLIKGCHRADHSEWMHDPLVKRTWTNAVPRCVVTEAAARRDAITIMPSTDPRHEALTRKHGVDFCFVDGRGKMVVTGRFQARRARPM